MSELAHRGQVFVPGLTVQVQVPGYNHRIKASLLGSRERRYLALHDPASGAAELETLHLRPGDTLVVRFFHDGVAYGFRSNVQMTLREPETIVFISYPDETESLSLRQSPRLYCDVPVGVSCQGESLPGVMLDVSATGCRLAVPESPVFETEAVLQVKLVLPDSVTDVQAVIRRCEESGCGQVLGLSAEVGEIYERLEAYFRYRPPM